MFQRTLIGAAAVAALLCVSIAGAIAEDAKKYPDWDGLWKRGSPVGVWDPTKPGGLGQQPPLTAEYQKVFESNLAKGKAGVMFDIKGTCGPVGMPRVMIMYEPMEIVIKPKATYMLLESMSPVRRIYTDGRGWPDEADAPQFVGYSIGKWSDTDGDGTYDTLEVETRYMRGPRLMDSTGIPLHADNETVVKEKLYLDKSDRDILRNEITTFDHAFTRPWTVSRDASTNRTTRISVHRGQSLGFDRRRALSRGRRRLPDADPERPGRARSEISAEIFSAEKVNFVIPGPAARPEPGIHNPCRAVSLSVRGYGFRVRELRSRPGMTVTASLPITA
jgi:hypothetical protein